jgi:tRNA(Phe) wybutosine-synthesizing methylase Tyw3
VVWCTRRLRYSIDDWRMSLNQVLLLSCSSTTSSSSQDNNDPLLPPLPPLPAQSDVLVTFLFEPMVLHVAACNLQRGQELLQIALLCGFRESGLVVTAQRVTVAIRTHGLSMNVPFLASAATVATTVAPPPSDDAMTQFFYPSYLRALILEGNARLQRNQEKLNQLYSTIQQVLFVPQPINSLVAVAVPTMDGTDNTNHGVCHQTLAKVRLGIC